MNIFKHISILGVGLILMTGSGFAQESVTIKPNTPEATLALEQLQRAEESDRGNSHSFTDDNPSLDHYYARKAQHVKALLQKLDQGQPISQNELDDALHNTGAENYGAPLY